MSSAAISVRCWFGSLLVAVAGGCAGATPAPTVPVITAGSVCSGELPPLASAPSAVTSKEATTQPQAQLAAYVTEASPSELVVYDIDQGRERLRVKIALKNRPELLDDIVIAVDNENRVVAYDLNTGELRFRRPLDRSSWLGAVQVGSQVVFTSTSLSFRPAERGSTVTALDARVGSVLWERVVPYSLSRPVVLDERVLVVSDHADLWALRIRDGRNAGCATIGGKGRRGPIDWLETEGDQLRVGMAYAQELRLGSTAGAAPAEGAILELPLEPLPGRPNLRPSSYDSVPARRSAYGRVGVSARLTQAPGSAPQLASGHYYFAFYRQLFAYRADGQLAWAQLFPTDAVRVQPVGDAVFVLTEGGQMLWLSAVDGAELTRRDLPAHVASASVRLQDSTLAHQSAVSDPLALRAQLRAIAIDTDARLLPGRKVAVSALSTLDDPQVTRDLLDVYVQSAAPVELKRHVAAVLAKRKPGSEHLLAALNTSYDFLTGQPAPPLAAIVPGLVFNHEARAVPGLIDRLFDPDTQLSELRLVVDALVAFGNAETRAALARFFTLYHADSAFAADASALVVAAHALFRSPTATDKQGLEAAREDPATVAELRAELVPLMAAVPAAPLAQAKADEPPPAPAAALPARLSDEDIARTFAERSEALRSCLEAVKEPTLRALRFSFVLEHDGTLANLHVWPEREALTHCLSAKLTETRFPAFAQGRRMANYTWRVQPDSPAREIIADTEESAPFWRTAQLRGRMLSKHDAHTPWWRDQNPLFVSVDAPATKAPDPTNTVSEPSKPASDITGWPPAPEPKKNPTQPNTTDNWWAPTR